ncbi:hypothetical protein V0288_12260 [Pannus brasiliensis CCIBt3594]|uniref:Uncharacterized protein n=1 Tax=Pannus brasiliensis CCIBt3594 TaxID=1427578 RepID=A0AAW9QUA4_9CHRO
MTQPDNRENLSQREAIEALQQAIDRLNTLVSQLNTGSLESLPSREAIDNLLTSTREVASVLVPIPERTEEEDEFAGIEDILTPAFPAEEPKKPEREKPSFREKRGTSRGSRLPRTAILGGVLATVLAAGAVALFAFGIVKFPQNPPEIAANPPETVREDVPEVIETPPELKAPDVAIPVPIREPEPKLTPEQGLVAAIQEEITELTNRYPEGLISTVEVDFLAGRLTVFVGDSWYDLKPARQDKFADSIFQRARDLDFTRLEVKDNSGVLVARSPVIGDRVIIVERTRGVQSS